MSWRSEGVLIARALALRLTRLVDLALVEQAAGAEPRQAGDRHVVADRQHAHDPGQLAILGEQREPGVRSRRRGC